MHNSLCTSTSAALALRDTIVFWVVPVDKLNTVLRAHPDVTVAVCVTDEFIVDTPRERGRTLQSPVINRLITQATPQDLGTALRRCGAATGPREERTHGQKRPRWAAAWPPLACASPKSGLGGLFRRRLFSNCDLGEVFTRQVPYAYICVEHIVT